MKSGEKLRRRNSGQSVFAWCIPTSRSNCDCFGRPISLDPELAGISGSKRWATHSSFPQVPSHLLSSHSWKKKSCLTNCSSTTTSSDGKPSPVGHCHSVNLSTVLCFASGRSRDFRLLVPDQTVCIGVSGTQHQDEHQMGTKQIQQQREEQQRT